MKAKPFDMTISETLFPYYLATNAKEYNAVMKLHNNPERGFPDEQKYGACCVHFFHDDTPEKYVVICLGLDHGRSAHESHALLVHEAMHLWRHIRKHLVERKPSKEFEAYAMQYICLNLFSAYDKAMKKWKKKNEK